MARHGRAILQISRWTGGLNTRVNRFLVRDDQATEVMNFFFGLGGILRVRKGSEKRTITSLGPDGIKSGVRYYPPSGPPRIVVDWRDGTYVSSDDGRTLSPLQTGLLGFVRATYVQVRDILYRADGVNEPKKYDGTFLTKWGIDPPLLAPSASGTTGGSLVPASTYKVRVTFVSDTAESNPSPEVTVNLTSAQNAISLTGIPVSADPQVKKRRIYRTRANGAIFYFDTEIPNNTTTSVTLTKADSALGIEMPEDKDPPPRDLFLCELFKNRLFGVRASERRKLYFSEFFEPEAWPVDYFITIPFPEGDQIVGLKALGDLLFIFGTSSVFVLVGDSPFNFTVRQTFADEGFVSANGVVVVENVLMGPTRYGFQAFDGTIVKILSWEIEPTIRTELDQTRLDTIVGVYDLENRVVRWCVPLAAGGRGEFVYDLFHRTWTRTDRNMSVYIPFHGAPDRGELYSGSSTDGSIWRENVGYSDDGRDIKARYRTKTFDFNTPRQRKRLWHLWVETLPFAGTLKIEARGDSGQVSQVFFPSASGFVHFYGDSTKKYGDSTRPYGGTVVGVWDDGFTYDPSTQQDFIVRHVEFLIEWSGKDWFEMYRLDAEYEVEGWYARR